MRFPAYLSSWNAFRTASARAGRRTLVLAGGLLVAYWSDRAVSKAARHDPPRLPTSDPSVVAIPAGEFLMGSNEGDDDERPIHRVDLAAYAIDRTEVTVHAYLACVASEACTASGRDGYCNGGRTDKGEQPVNCVDWSQAEAFCIWRGSRLPTEAEWEYAARGTDGRAFPWGDARPDVQLCWDGPGSDLGQGRRRGTCAVGAHPAGRSAFGVDDMAGNVWEWTAGFYSPAYDKLPTELRVVRGGTWFGYDRADVRASLRFRVPPKTRDYGVGFRCARSL